MKREKPFEVTAPEGKTRLIIMNATDGLPAAFALMGTRAATKVAIRLAGGCKGMEPSDKEQMLDFFSQAFTDYRGLIWSGGTRQTDTNGHIDPMVTDIPGIIASKNAGCIALGTVPRTAMLSLQEESRLVLDDWGTVLNPDMSGILIVQNGPDGEMGWDGDVNTYFRLMEQWRNFAGFTGLGLISWNGGPVTADEIIRAINQGWPTFLIEGTGRATDEFIEGLRKDDPDFLKKVPQGHLGLVFVVSKEEPKRLHYLLKLHGFISG